MNTPDLTQTPINADGSFEEKKKKSGQTLQVGKAQSILNALQDAGHEVPFSCSQGVCGTCLTQVVAGTPDHWDMFLTPEEQEANTQMLICCSRSQTARLVLDL